MLQQKSKEKIDKKDSTKNNKEEYTRREGGCKSCVRVGGGLKLPEKVK